MYLKLPIKIEMQLSGRVLGSMCKVTALKHKKEIEKGTIITFGLGFLGPHPNLNFAKLLHLSVKRNYTCIAFSYLSTFSVTTGGYW